MSAIFVANATERKLAEQFIDETVVTPILNASIFYPIKGDESYHQDFYKNNSIRSIKMSKLLNLPTEKAEQSRLGSVKYETNTGNGCRFS